MSALLDGWAGVLADRIGPAQVFALAGVLVIVPVTDGVTTMLAVPPADMRASSSSLA